MHRQLFVSIIFIVTLFYGCVSVKPLNTSSGKPEVTIRNVTKKQVTDALVSEMLSSGFTIKSSSEYNIVFGKLIENNLAASLLLGSRYDSTPEHRLSFMLVETGNGVRVVLTNLIITNPGSAFERVTDGSKGEAGESWQEYLTSFAQEFRGKVGIDFNNDGTITKIYSNSPAMESKIQIGDKILSVNGQPFRITSEVSGEPGTNLVLVVLRNNEKMEFNITRRIIAP